MDEQEKKLIAVVVAIVKKLDGADAEVKSVQGITEINDEALQQMVSLIDQLGGIILETSFLYSWRDTVPDEEVLSDMQNILRIANGKGSLTPR